MSRNLRITLFISVGVHLLAMSAVTIIIPGDVHRMRTYTRVEFLGSILKKTAFDIMMETPPVGYDRVLGSYGDKYLEVSVPKIKSPAGEYARYQIWGVDSVVLDFFTGSKESVPDLLLDLNGDRPGGRVYGSEGLPNTSGRKVIYSPPAPSIMPGLYGGKNEFSIRFRVLVGADGNVRKAEPLTTTGYPGVDIMAGKFVRTWIFEPKEYIKGEDEWLEIEVVLKQ